MYLKKNMYGNAKTSDLWAGISEASGVDVAKVMDAWITKVGYPVVTVEETENGLNVIQNRFLSKCLCITLYINTVSFANDSM